MPGAFLLLLLLLLLLRPPRHERLSLARGKLQQFRCLELPHIFEYE